MNRPGTRFFIGPLKPAQRRRRERSLETFRVVDEIAYTRNIPMAEAFRALHYEEKNRWLINLQQSGHPRYETI